ncbi:NAD(P)/FAD-dependent oxidoreductase [Paracoccaceae bacterium GXU_MW_L88]
MADYTDGTHTGSYYAASANPSPERPPLRADIEAEICVIGGGFTGLSAALHLAEAGKQVVLLEGAKIGWGASGRNGGQVVNGLNAGLPKIAKQYGQEMADFVGGLYQEGGDIIRDRIARYDIACDYREGNIFVATTPRHMREIEGFDQLLRRYGMDSHELLDEAALRQHIGSDFYVGGMIDRKGGHLHPLNLALGEAAALESLGVVIYEDSIVREVEYSGAKPVVITNEGRVTAGQVVICGNAYLGHVVPALTARVMPVSTQVMATEPLPEDVAKRLLPTGHCAEDTRYILDYYRLSADNRLLFGGGTVYGGKDPADVEAKLRPAMETVFPEIKGVKVDYAWSGNFALSFSRVPQMGRLADHTWFAHGYSGHGVTGSHLFGRILSEAITGDTTRFDRFAALKWFPFPGGRTLGPLYSTLGSWWYAARDRFGI